MRCLPVAALALIGVLATLVPASAETGSAGQSTVIDRLRAELRRAQQDGAPPPDARMERYQYVSVCQAWLQLHTKYPPEAREGGIEGMGIVMLVITRDGTLESHQLYQSTGHRILDDAMMEAVSRASPFPPFPESRTDDTATLLLPVKFRKDK